MAEKNLPVGQIVKDGQLIEFLGCQILKDNQWYQKNVINKRFRNRSCRLKDVRSKKLDSVIL